MAFLVCLSFCYITALSFWVDMFPTHFFVNSNISNAQSSELIACHFNTLKFSQICIYLEYLSPSLFHSWYDRWLVRGGGGGQSSWVDIKPQNASRNERNKHTHTRTHTHTHTHALSLSHTQECCHIVPSIVFKYVCLN